MLAVTSRDDKTSAMGSYEVVQDTGASFDGLQVRGRGFGGGVVELMWMVGKCKNVRFSTRTGVDRHI